MLQLLGGVAAAGAIATGATALTGSGVVWGAGAGAGATQFVGGTLTQTVNGATIDNVQYANDGTGTHITSITVTVSGADQKYLQLTTTGGVGLTATATAWECVGDISSTVNGAVPKVKINKASGAAAVVCTAGNSGAMGYYDGLASLALAVTNA